MNNFIYHNPTELVFGKGQIARLSKLIPADRRIMITFGGGSVKRNGVYEQVVRALEGRDFVEFWGIEPNPSVETVREAVALGRENGSDFLLAVGGGSVIDSAKAIALGLAYEGDVWDLFSGQPAQDCLPVGTVLTIAAAGSEMSDSHVITNEALHLKRGRSLDLIRPAVAFLNPALTYTVSPFQTGCGIVDIMMHTLERYFNPGHPSNRMTDEIAEGLLRTVIDAGRVAMQDSHNYDAMSEIMWAGSLSHNNLTGLGGVKDFSVHQFGHELSGMFDAAHGATLSVMWPQWARYVVDTDPARFAHYGEAVWRLTRKDGESDRDLALRAIDTTEEFFRSIDMPTTFTELGIGVLSEEQLRELAERCTFFHTRVVGKFCPLDYDGILAVYRMANK